MFAKLIRSYQSVSRARASGKKVIEIEIEPECSRFVSRKKYRGPSLSLCSVLMLFQHSCTLLAEEYMQSVCIDPNTCKIVCTVIQVCVKNYISVFCV